MPCRNPARNRFSSLLPLLFAWAVGCGGGSNPRDMDAFTKAKKVRELREEAEYQLGLFLKSEGDEKGVNREALFAYRDRWKDITDIMGPADFPGGYAQYGEALSRVALYFRTLSQLYEKDLRDASSDSEREEAHIGMEKSRADAVKNFALSSRQFEIYFQASQNQLDARYYRSAIGNCEYLKDYRGALRYLELLEGSGALSDRGKGEVAQLRKQYNDALRLQEEGDLDREFNKSRTDDKPRSPRSGVGSEPAN